MQAAGPAAPTLPSLGPQLQSAVRSTSSLGGQLCIAPHGVPERASADIHVFKGQNNEHTTFRLWRRRSEGNKNQQLIASRCSSRASPSLPDAPSPGRPAVPHSSPATHGEQSAQRQSQADEHDATAPAPAPRPRPRPAPSFGTARPQHLWAAPGPPPSQRPLSARSCPDGRRSARCPPAARPAGRVPCRGEAPRRLQPQARPRPRPRHGAVPPPPARPRGHLREEGSRLPPERILERSASPLCAAWRPAAALHPEEAMGDRSAELGIVAPSGPGVCRSGRSMAWLRGHGRSGHTSGRERAALQPHCSADGPGSEAWVGC